jgi:hypothetical protein
MSEKVSIFQSLREYTEDSKIRLFAIFCALLMAWPVTQIMTGGKETQVRHKAEILSYQLAQLYQESRPSLKQIGDQAGSDKVRGPASVSDSQATDFRAEGLLGKDPWGQAYEYKILNSEIDSVSLQIRSSGPDRKFEVSTNSEESSLSSSGDDLLMVFKVPINKN